MPTLTFEPIVVPLRTDEHGAIRVGNTRVLLDLVIHAFQTGATPEEVVDSYDGLSLADVYAVLTNYLQNPGPIDEYLRRREAEAEAVRCKIEASQAPGPTKDELLARAKVKGLSL